MRYRWLRFEVASNASDGADPPAQTLVGVAALGLPGMLVEIEATAVTGS